MLGVVALPASPGYPALQCVTPANIQRKTTLVTAIEQTLERAQPELASWLEQLHAQVDELDALEPPWPLTTTGFASLGQPHVTSASMTCEKDSPTLAWQSAADG